MRTVAVVVALGPAVIVGGAGVGVGVAEAIGVPRTDVPTSTVPSSVALNATVRVIVRAMARAVVRMAIGGWVLGIGIVFRCGERRANGEVRAKGWVAVGWPCGGEAVVGRR